MPKPSFGPGVLIFTQTGHLLIISNQKVKGRKKKQQTKKPFFLSTKSSFFPSP
jgi:hypothetical protein